MIENKGEMKKIMRGNYIAEIFIDILDGKVDPLINTICSNPFDFSIPIFKEHKDNFTFSKNLVIMWDFNCDSIVGFLTDKKVFIEYFFEDGPNRYKVVASNYQQFCFYVLKRFVESHGLIDSKILSEKMRFKYYDKILDIYNSSYEQKSDLKDKLQLIFTKIEEWENKGL